MPFSTAKSWAAEPSAHLIVSELQPLKASDAMLVTLDGIVMLLSDVQSAKASSAIVVVPDGTVTEVSDEQP